MRISVVTSLLAIMLPALVEAQLGRTPQKFTVDDSLRGTLNANRSWWDVQRYDIIVTPDYTSETIVAQTSIRFSSSKPGKLMQIDLQQPLQIDSIVLNQQQRIAFTRKNNTALLQMPAQMQAGEHNLHIYYHGQPRKAVRAPWDGGWVWAKDNKGRPWMTVACQGLGASVWYPCKDHQSDEPDLGASLTMIVPDTLTAVGNGRLTNKMPMGDKTAWRWEVKNPINNYNIIPYIGKYVSFEEQYNGEDGVLDCSYWVLDYELEKAKEQFKQVKPMLQCFEHWFGPYPFYADGYKLVQSSHLGMEHQSAVAYGNNFMNGYRGRDLSGTGWGSKWDFIIIHESGHEWFGNNITSKDIADMWIHEGFTNYSETIYTQCLFGKAAGEAYVQGIRKNIMNDRPIIGEYGVNHEGSGDMYYKAANMIHTIRTAMQNDSSFRQLLRGMYKTYYHGTTSTVELQAYMQQFVSFDVKAVFDQYLRTTQIPLLQWSINSGQLKVKFTDCNAAFRLPVYLPTGNGQGVWKTIHANEWTTIATSLNDENISSEWNKNLYIRYQD
ncbi:MAG: M1 family metallopeptidase [Chitinophagaceae bacterium]|nr:M1 family metallopeptidase [Chitinophagaceae bacterium]